jgi:hypothetical protein
MNLEIIRPRGRPRNRWQDEVSEDGRIVVGKVWQENLYTRKEWQKHPRKARNGRNLHMPVELTLSLLMSYIYGAHCKARNFNDVYIWK